MRDLQLQVLGTSLAHASEEAPHQDECGQAIQIIACLDGTNREWSARCCEKAVTDPGSTGVLAETSGDGRSSRGSHAAY
jgi:hypothetical protein